MNESYTFKQVIITVLDVNGWKSSEIDPNLYSAKLKI